LGNQADLTRSLEISSDLSLENNASCQLSRGVSEFHPFFSPGYSKLLNDHLNGHLEAYESEHRLSFKSGGLILVLAKGKVIDRDESGKPPKVCGNYLDITARRQLENSLN